MLWRVLKFTKTQMLKGDDLFADTHLFCDLQTHTHTHSQNPFCRPLLFLLLHWPTSQWWRGGDEIAGWMRTGSNFCLPPSFTNFISPFFPLTLGCSLHFFNHRAASAASGLLVCEYVSMHILHACMCFHMKVDVLCVRILCTRHAVAFAVVSCWESCLNQNLCPFWQTVSNVKSLS